MDQICSAFFNSNDNFIPVLTNNIESQIPQEVNTIKL